MDKNKESTLRCVLVLTAIAVVCAVLLAILYPILYVAPSVESISKNVTNSDLGAGEGDEVEWKTEDLIDEFVKGKGGSVSMAASTEVGGETFYGLLVGTKADGKLQECQFAFYIRKSDDKLFKCVIVEDGATSGRDYEYAEAHDKYDNVKSIENGDYYVTISGNADSVYGDFSVPKCGATKTVTAIDNAFRLAANYYYYVFGGGAR